jgi:hypothetical protein
MAGFLQMNIFFMVTTFIVVFVGILLIVLLIRLIQIFHRIRDEIDLVRGDIAKVRTHLETGGTFLKNLLGFFKPASKRPKK